MALRKAWENNHLLPWIVDFQGNALLPQHIDRARETVAANDQISDVLSHLHKFSDNFWKNRSKPEKSDNGDPLQPKLYSREGELELFALRDGQCFIRLLKSKFIL